MSLTHDVYGQLTLAKRIKSTEVHLQDSCSLDLVPTRESLSTSFKIPHADRKAWLNMSASAKVEVQMLLNSTGDPRQNFLMTAQSY